MPLGFPSAWNGFVIRDPSGSIRRKGAPASALDVGNLPRGRYQLGSPTDASQTAELIVSSDIPGGVYRVDQIGAGTLSLAFDPAAYSGPYRVTIQSSAGVSQSYYAYGAVAPLNLGSGDWRVTLAKPGEQGITTLFRLSTSGMLTAVNGVAVIDPLLLDSAANWSELTIRNDAGAVVRTDTDTRTIDATGLAEGRYAVSGALAGKVRRQVLTVSNDFAGGAFVLEQQAPSGPVSVTIANYTPGTVYRLSLHSASGGPPQSFYVYRNQTQFTLPSGGNWHISLAEPGTAGVSTDFAIDPGGTLVSVGGLNLPQHRWLDLPSGWTGYHLLDPDGDVVRTAQGVTQADASGLPEGRYALKFGRSDTTQYDLVVSDRLPGGGVISYEQHALGGAVQLTLSGVSSNSPVLVILRSANGAARQSFYAYGNAVTLDVPVGEWTVQIARPSQAGLSMSLVIAANGELVSLEREAVSTDRRTKLPNGWTGYVIADPAGHIIRQVDSASSMDFTGLPDGRYSIAGPGLRDDRREVVISGAIPGEVAFVRQSRGQPAVLSFIDPIRSPYHLVHVYDRQGKPISSFYIYGDEVSLDFAPGDYRITVATPGATTFETRVSIGNEGALFAVNGVGRTDSSGWFPELIRDAGILGPITYNNGRAHLSMVGPGGATLAVQLRHDATGTISTYLTENTNFALPLTEGAYSWRAFQMPAQAASAGALDEYLAIQQGGWVRFEQGSAPLASDYVLGLEPDRIEFPAQLRLHFPAHSLQLDDGSILVANTMGSSIYRYTPDGTLRRVAGAFSTGYTSSGPGNSVLLNQPSQMQQMGDGTVWVIDYLNHAIREYDPATGYVRTLFGSPNQLEVVIVNGQLQSVGDVFAIGVDEAGLPFLSAARAQAAYGSRETRIVRQASDGTWYEWAPETTTLGSNYRFTDLLFTESNVWATVQTSDGVRQLLRYTQAGVLTGSIQLSSRFGRGLVRDPHSSAILVADHGNIVSVNPVTMAQSTYQMPIDLNNVASIRVYGTTLLITDSDAGQVLQYDTVAGRIVRAYGSDSAVSNIYIDLHAANGRLYALDNQTPRLIEMRDGAFNVLAGTGEQKRAVLGLAADVSPLRYPGAFTIGPDGTVYVVESNHRILAVGADRIVRHFAGSLNGGYAGDGGNASQANFRSIYGLAFDRAGVMLVADSYNHAIRAIGTDGVVRTIAGNGKPGISSNTFDVNGALNTPLRVLPTSDGRLFISDSWNNRVVELTSDNRLVSIAGAYAPSNYQGGGSFSGDGGLATEARLNTPIGLAYHDADQTLFIVDSFNDRVRYVDSAGRIHTLVGGQRGFESGALLNLPKDVALIGDDLYIADGGNGLVLKLSNVDRTGNDIANALNVSDASMHLNGFNRSEHVSAGDADFYDLGGFERSLLVRGESDGLTVTLYGADGRKTATHIIGAGQSYELAAGWGGYFGVTSSVHQGYSVRAFGDATRPLNVEYPVPQLAEPLDDMLNAGTDVVEPARTFARWISEVYRFDKLNGMLSPQTPKTAVDSAERQLTDIKTMASGHARMTGAAELQRTVLAMRQDLAAFAPSSGIEALKWRDRQGGLSHDFYAES
jgi:sugar lactone lactonase YvrE